MSENFNFDEIYRARRQKVYSYMKEKHIGASVFIDSEDCRDKAIRYLTGHPSDALVILTAEGKSFLVPWDINLAEEKAHADTIIPSAKFNRSNMEAIKEILKSSDMSFSKKVELPPSTSYINFEKYKSELKEYSLFCSESSTHKAVLEMRSVKDDYEIWCTKKACSITDEMTGIIVENIKTGLFKKESDVALFVEKYLREKGAEGTSFDTLCAGPDRSWAIHAFPGYTNADWGTKGLSILDYGVSWEGYASDCTITIARDVNKEQKKLLELVQTAADQCLELYKPGLDICQASLKADQIFAEADMKMPHSLGHGTGLDIHEEPFIRVKTEAKFQAGNIVTLEPGLYVQGLGGCRLENDILITEQGNEVLTNSKIYYL